MLIVRLKQLEHALSDGRLDAAYDLARAADLRADRRGAELAARLAGALTHRGRQHADAGRIAEAAADCEKAAALAGNVTEVAELRAAVADATAVKREADRLRGHQLAAAKRHIDAGQLTLGQELLRAIATTDVDASAEAMSHDLAARRALVRSAVAKATAALESDDWQAAVDHVSGVCRTFPSDGEVGTITARIAQRATTLISRAIEAGRLDLASLYFDRLGRLGRPAADLEPLGRTLRDCRAAFDLIRRAEAGDAMEILRRLSMLWPDAAWLVTACAELRRAADALETLRTGPLGLMAGTPAPFDPHETQPMAAPPKQSPRGLAAVAPQRASARMAERLVLHADGIGSFLVIDRSAVTIGPAGSSAGAGADVQFLAGGDVPPVTITRADGDYFLRAAHGVRVNDRPATADTLLANGDAISIGPRGRIVFRRPSAASGTAILDMTAARLARGDVRQVILLDREILIGPGAGAHVRCDTLAQAAVLQQSGGRWLLRSSESVQVDGRPAPRPAEFASGAHVRMGTVSFVIAKG